MITGEAKRELERQRYHALTPEQLIIRRDRQRIAERERYARNPEKYRAKNRAKYARNPQFHRDRTARYFAKHPERRKINRFRHTLRQYGLTPESYDALLKSQGGRCAICGATKGSTNGKHRFHIDHDHDTGVVRGLLCNLCNAGLGGFRDDPKALARAIVYLQK